MTLNIITREHFSDMVYDRMCNDGDFIDSIIEVAETLKIELDDIPQLLTDKLKMLVSLEAKEKKLLKDDDLGVDIFY